MGMHAWTIHPFTACSLPQPGKDLVFFIRPRSGLTARLARYASSGANPRVRVLLDGPYGGVDMHKIEQSKRMLVIAGGSGAGWILPFVLAHLRKVELVVKTDKPQTRPSLKIVVATRDIPTKEWFESELSQILASVEAVEDLFVETEIFYTGLKGGASAQSAEGCVEPFSDLEKANATGKTSDLPVTGSDGSSTDNATLDQKLRHSERRPDLAKMIRDEGYSCEDDSSLGVFVCGPLSMQSDVSQAVAKEQIGIVKSGRKSIYLHMEHFSWA